MFLSEYRIQHGAIGPLYVTSSYSTWIFCRGVSGFATDCSCDAWCRGLTTCLLHVGQTFGNRFLNTSWAVGLTYWIVFLHFFCILTYATIHVLIHHVIFGFIFTSLIFFSSTPVLTSSIDVVFVLSTWINISNYIHYNVWDEITHPFLKFNNWREPIISYLFQDHGISWNIQENTIISNIGIGIASS